MQTLTAAATIRQNRVKCFGAYTTVSHQISAQRPRATRGPRVWRSVGPLQDVGNNLQLANNYAWTALPRHVTLATACRAQRRCPTPCCRTDLSQTQLNDAATSTVDKWLEAWSAADSRRQWSTDSDCQLLVTGASRRHHCSDDWSWHAEATCPTTYVTWTRRFPSTVDDRPATTSHEVDHRPGQLLPEVAASHSDCSARCSTETESRRTPSPARRTRSTPHTARHSAVQPQINSWHPRMAHARVPCQTHSL